MTSIQLLLTLNCSVLVLSKSNLATVAIVNPRVASVVRRAVCLIASSCSRGMSIVMIAPTAGMKTTRVNAQESNQFIEPIPLA